ncbi:endonuclease domain-containing protein [Pedobacter africanus]|uniref:Very-short-patch-repair endonuclease n=1 Tax=Pedobacter africanus TaxID=151894 RepID=A0ACC6KUD5_9SPHI|nr:endonuclease domain-containing protein [Pedobacter africanus]MDR6782716.1 very-short-patch-repair endonuclease [Pedobacter africanus]
MNKTRFTNKTEFIEKVAFRRQLRLEATPAERLLWYALRDRRFKQIKFRRQHSIGAYTVDFYCAQYRLVIELDGAVHDDIAQSAYDMNRDAFIRSQRYQVLRFQNADVFDCMECVLTKIEETILHLKC